ncbi:MAG TPA: hypothetical protein VG738_03530 [Chitinophagaceae bacterium]|nr:hypothetical protein [Chitinophagaceae bacterium]
MKKRTAAMVISIVAITTCVIIAACTKDTGFIKMQIYTPVYKSSGAVRAEISTGAPQAIASEGKLFLIGHYIFMSEPGKGIHIIDNSNPSSPVNKAFISIPGNLDVSVKGNTLYADCYNDLLVIDVSNIEHISCKTYLHNIFPDRAVILGAALPEGQVIVDWKVRDTSADLAVSRGQGIWKNNEYYYSGPPVTWLSDQTAFYAAASGPKSNTGVAGSNSRLAIINNHLYAASDYTLASINISNPASPQVENIGSSGIDAQTIFPFNNKLFIGGSHGITIFSADNASAPVEEGSFGHYCCWDPIIADDTTAYITLHTGNMCDGTIDELDVLDVSDISNPKSIRNYTLTSPKGLWKDGNLLFICDGPELKIFNAAQPANIMLLKEIALADTYDVICYNNIAYVSAKGGLYQFDYSNLNAIKQLSKISLP